jgi:hypothetical protein
VSFPPSKRKSTLLVFRRVLKEEYNRTRNRVIGKAQFPTLLEKLWKTNAVEKTNIVRSFMKAGVFPLNSKVIDRSRVLKSSDSTPLSSDTHSIDPIGNSKKKTLTMINPKDSNGSSSVDANAQVVNSSTSAIRRAAPGFTSSRQALVYLDRVLEETMCNDDEDDCDADDNHADDDDFDVSEGIDEASSDDENTLYQYIPNQSAAPKRTHGPSDEAPVRRDRHSSPSAKRLSSEQQARRIIGFDTSDEEGADLLFISLSLSNKIHFSRRARNETVVRPIGTIASSDKYNPAIDVCTIFK